MRVPNGGTIWLRGPDHTMSKVTVKLSIKTLDIGCRKLPSGEYKAAFESKSI